MMDHRLFVGDVALLAGDGDDQRLRSQVSPLDWQNPVPHAVYDLVVVGGGAAGLVTAVGAAGLGIGLRVALVESQLLGGDCLNVGCVPSKTLIRSA
ncbi:MAG: FAD-dependent oxidoreductase, partial [Oscillatoriales cyanobacterium SM2_2_1]|nr:FAD-dependent oxidoreductase [Oscillatoriales cyanobacterium SM2_2_1]